jgi:exo-beta-1,3-glucanase (GH17 family)
MKHLWSINNPLAGIFLLSAALGLAGCVWREQAVSYEVPLNLAPPSPPANFKVQGLAFGPFVNGQDPNRGASISEAHLERLLRQVIPYTESVRTYGCTNGLEKAGAVAHRLGLKIAVGVWLGRDLPANEREISQALKIAANGEADMLVVGNEALLRKDLTEEQLIGYIEKVKGQTEIPVTSAETYETLLRHPNLINTVEVVMPHYYPFWSGISHDQAIAKLHAWHQEMVAAAKNKPIIIGETGWPTCGSAHGKAVPSLENAAFYFRNFVSWARATNVRYYYFEALDEGFKSKYEGDFGACWGLLTSTGRLKTGMQAVFDGRLMADNWTPPPAPSQDLTPSRPTNGKPALEFTFVPPYGAFGAVQGRAKNVPPAAYKVAVLIYVGGNWWSKPYANSPATSIQADGAWSCAVTTGGVDQTALKIAAFLVPKDFELPVVMGGANLPATLERAAIAKVIVDRKP